MHPTLNLLAGSRRYASASMADESSPARRLAHIVDQAFFATEGDDAPMQAALALAPDWGAAVAGLSRAQRESLQRRLGPEGLAELAALGGEPNAELFSESLLALARRQEAAGRLEAAASLYAAVAESGLGGQPLRDRAQSSLDAIFGRGASGPRAEFLLRRLAREATEPSTLIAMTAAGALFRATRLAALSRLAASPSANFFTRGVGARAVSGLAGFALEAPAFTLGGRLSGEALGRASDWSGSALGRDIASSYLVLGGLRVAGWGSGALYRGLAGPAPAGRISSL